MIKKAVPKCKECNCHWGVSVHDYSNKNNHYCHWWCMSNFKNIGGIIDILKTGFHAEDGKYIKSQEFQTSPKWCPKRIKE